MEENEFDFGGFYGSSIENNLKFSPAIVAQSMSDLRKENPKLKIDFSDESYKSLKEKYGESVAEDAKNIYSEALDLTAVTDKHQLFRPISLDSFRNREKGFEISKDVIGDMKQDPVFRNSSYFKPFQYKTYQEATEANSNYFDRDESGNVVKKKLKESEDYGDVSGAWTLGFGGESLVVATNEYVAKNVDPSLQEKIDNGEINPDSYYTDENGDYSYRSLDEGEENFDHVRSIFGPREVYNAGFLKESAKGFYDGLIGLVEGAGTIAYYGSKYSYMPLKLAGYDGLDNYFNDRFADFMSVTKKLKSSGSMEEDRGWNHSFTNFMKLAMNGVGQIAGTFGAGLAVRGGMYGLSALSKAAKVGSISPALMADIAGGTTRALNFGIAAKAGKEESMRAGLSKNESDLLGLVAGSIMLGTEYLTGSQFIPKMAGREAYKESSKKVTSYFIEQAEKQGLTVAKFIEKNPSKIKDAVFRAHKWLESPAKNRMSGFAKGFAGESIQEFTEDFTNNLVQDGYDLVTGTKKFDNDWNDIMNDLLGSFLIGGFSGGMVKGATSSGKGYKRDLVDDKRNHFMINEVVNGNTEAMEKGLEHTFLNEGLASKVVSANRDEKGRRMTVSNDNGLNAMSENDFFYKMYKSQLDFVKKTHGELKGKFATNQELADRMYEMMGQKITDVNTDINDLAKGVNMAMEIEGMQLFREESLLKGDIALKVAKSKTDSLPTLENIEDIRFYNNTVLAVKRSGEAEFTPATAEETTALNQAYREIYSGDTGKGLTDLALKIKDYEKSIAEIDFKLKRIKFSGIPTEQGVALEEQRNELTKELEKETADFKATLKDRGLNLDLNEDMVSLSYLDEFKNTLLNGERTQRYVENFSLNMAKEKFPDIFRGRESYNIEDFKMDGLEEEYFVETFKEGQTLLGDIALETDQELNNVISDNAALPGDILNHINNLVLSNAPMKKETIDKVREFIGSMDVGITDEQRTRYAEVKIKLASMVRAEELMDEYMLSFMSENGVDEIFKQTLSDNTDPSSSADAILESFDGESLSQIRDSIVSKSSTLPDSDKKDLEIELNDLFLYVPEFVDVRSKATLAALKSNLEEKLKNRNHFQESGIDNEIFSYGTNQNKVYMDNLVIGESGIKDGIDKLLAIKQEEFIDSGEIDALRGEIMANLRFMVAKMTAIQNNPDRAVQASAITQTMGVLESYLSDLDNLQLISDNNRGNRFNRDYEVKQSVIFNSFQHLSAIDGYLKLGFEDRLAVLNDNHPVNDEGKVMIDEQYNALQEIEIEISEIVSKLTEEQTDELLQGLGLLDFKYNHKARSPYEYIFKSNHEDQQDPFNSKSERDMVEARLNYLLMIGRGNLRNFWTYSDETLSRLDLNKTKISSQEQLFIAKQTYTKLAQEGESSIDRSVERNFGDDKYKYFSEGVFVRGIGGAGKSTFVMNLVFDIIASHKKDRNETTTLLYSAPNQEQIDNVGEAFKNIGENVTSESFVINHSDPKFKKMIAGDSFKGIGFIVVDEATVLNTELNALIDAVKKHNENDNNPNKIKLILVGDEFQNTGVTDKPNLYSQNVMSFMERTVPLTTPYRTGKVESFDIQSGHRNMLSSLLTLQSVKGGSGYDFIIPGSNEKVKIENTEAKISAFNKIVAEMTPNKITSYMEKNGVTIKGVRGVADRRSIIDLFAKDLSENWQSEDRTLVYVTDNVDAAVNEIKEQSDVLGVNLSKNEIREFVKSSKEVQGLSYGRVYTDVVAEGDNIDSYINRLRSLYVAESREREALIVLSPDNKITSKVVSSEQSIPSFPPLELDMRDDSGNLSDDSLALIANNEHIAQVVKELAGDKTGVKEKPESSESENYKSGKKDDGTNEEENELDLENPLTQKKMTEEEKKAAEEAMKQGMTMEQIDEFITNSSLEEMREAGKKLKPSDFKKVCE